MHGGGFCVGSSRDDDEWNRRFADRHGALVVALTYSKAPWAPFPTAVHDIEAVLLAVLSDESLPLDRAYRRNTQAPASLSLAVPAPIHDPLRPFAPPPPPPKHTRTRTALLGFSAGANLALAAAQLPTLRPHLAAAVSVCGLLDLSVPARRKLANRPFKTAAFPDLDDPRGAATDDLVHTLPAYCWGYVPYGHDLRDPLLSPAWAAWESLPPFVGVVAAELDLLAFEGWQFACRLAREGTGGRRVVPGRRAGEVQWSVCGRADGTAGPGAGKGSLHDGGDERFGFEERWTGGGVKWLLVPDVVHGFDKLHLRQAAGGGEEVQRDAELKTAAYVDEVGRWLTEKVWKL